jgi:DNA-binding NarL/FixJ family response regulator
MIRVAIADDQALIRSGLRALLQTFDGLEVIGEAANGEEAISLVSELRPDVLLLDVRMPRLGGVEVLGKLAALGCSVPTLLLTTFEDDSALVAGVRAGARGFLLKGVTAEVLVQAIQTIARGESYLFASLAAMPAEPAGEWRKDALDQPFPLTAREKEILKLMTSGISNRQIASALRLSEGTVRNHASNIFSKLGVCDRTRAVLHALDRGLV